MYVYTMQTSAPSTCLGVRKPHGNIPRLDEPAQRRSLASVLLPDMHILSLKEQPVFRVVSGTVIAENVSYSVLIATFSRCRSHRSTSVGEGSAKYMGYVTCKHGDSIRQ
jgi:hypothetical protein